jgi:hypothetical protein
MAVRLSAIRAGRLYLPGKFVVLISVSGWIDPRVIMRLEGLGKLKKSNDFIGNWTRDLSPCSIVPPPPDLKGMIWQLKRRFCSQRMMPSAYKQLSQLTLRGIRSGDFWVQQAICIYKYRAFRFRNEYSGSLPNRNQWDVVEGTNFGQSCLSRLFNNFPVVTYAQQFNTLHTSHNQFIVTCMVATRHK